MKSLAIAVAIILAAFAAVPSQALNYESDAYVITNGNSSAFLTNAVAGPGTNSSLAVVVDVQGQKNIALSLRTKLDGAGTTAANYLFVGTVDGTNYSGDTKRTLVVTPTGTLTVNTVTNFDCTGFKSLKLTTIQNPNTTVLTNLQFDVGYKEADSQ